MTYPVKYMTSEFAGAPRCSGTAGDLVALLDACLIDGFNVLSVSSLVVASDEATVDFGTAHGYIVGQIVLIDGATPTDLNGEQYVTWVDTTTIKFTTSGIADQTATGTIGCRTAPVGGWEKVFSGINKAVYHSIDPASTGFYLRVDDTADQYAVCRGYETMTDIDTGIGDFPRVADAAYGYVWKRAKYTNTDALPWLMVGDSMLFYLGVAWHSSYQGAGIQRSWYSFGDIVSYKVSDAFHCIIGGHYNTTSPTYPATNNDFSRTDGYLYSDISRSYTQTGSSTRIKKYGFSGLDNFGYNGSVYPSPVDNSLQLHMPVIITEDNGAHRGYMPGVLQPIQSDPLTDLDQVSGIAQLPGRYVLIAQCQAIAGSTAYGRVAFDITGPWR